MRARAMSAAWILIVAAGAVPLSVPLAAQAEPAARAAHDTAPSITSTDIARHLAALAADSVPPVDTTNPQLDVGAQYVAEQFGQIGLQPGFRAGSALGPWLQEYPLPGGQAFDYDSTPLLIGTFVRKGGVEIRDEDGSQVPKAVRLSLATDAPLVRGSVREGYNGLYLGFTFFGWTRRPEPVIVAGPHTLASASRIAVRGKVVFYVPPAGLGSVLERQLVDTLARGSKGVIVVTGEDAEHFVVRQRSVQRPLSVIDNYMKMAKAGPSWLVYTRLNSLEHLFTLAGLDLVELRRARTPVAREALPLSAWFYVPPLSGPSSRRAANVVGMLEGSDSVLKRQYVVVTAHLNPARAGRRSSDNTSGSAQRASADDASAHDASGVAGLLTLARAFVEAGARPRRSLLFVATSGADHEFAGAEFVASLITSELAQMRPRTRAVATLSLDRIGGRHGDSVTVDGLEEIDFGLLPTWVTSAHANTDLTILSGSILSAPCADQCAFVRWKVPSLYLHDPNAAHGSGQPPTPVLATSNSTHAARVTRLAFDLVQAIANAGHAARWSAGILERLSQSGDGD